MLLNIPCHRVRAMASYLRTMGIDGETRYVSEAHQMYTDDSIVWFWDGQYHRTSMEQASTWESEWQDCSTWDPVSFNSSDLTVVYHFMFKDPKIASLIKLMYGA